MIDSKGTVRTQDQAAGGLVLELGAVPVPVTDG